MNTASSSAIPTMKSLRNAHVLARFVLVWFVLSIGVAIASPLIHPQALELICSGAGAMKLVKTDDGSKEMPGHTLDCPLCVLASAPPPVARLTAEALQPLAHMLQKVPAAHIASMTGAPLPARGPPICPES